MNAIFGVPASSIMLALVAIFAVSLAIAGWIMLRYRVTFRMGVRNIPRRPAQTVLILIGLMLSTLIIAAAFTTGDTMNASVTGQAERILGATDERVVPTSGETDTGPPAGGAMPSRIVEYLETQLADEPSIAGVMPYLSESVPAINVRTGLSEPTLNLVGLDPERLAPFGGLRGDEGPIDLAALPEGSVVLGEKAAELLDAQVGDVLIVFALNEPRNMLVHAIADDSMLTGYVVPGSSGGMTTTLQRAQDIFGLPGRISSIEVANAGGVDDTDDALAALGSALETFRYQAVPVKRNQMEEAEEAGNMLLTLFLVFGLFSVSVGVLLIFLIFVMLAAERKPEMGIARAIGMRRAHLTRMFIAEGIAYDLLAALVGAALGVGVAFVMAGYMNRAIGGAIAITPSASWRSLVIAYTLGVVVTFATIVVSSWRVSRLVIVDAIRDAPEPQLQRAPRRWLAGGAGSIVVGALLTWAGAATDQAALLMLGLSLVPFGLAAALRRFGLPARALYSIASLVVIVLWLLPEGVLDSLFGKTTGSMEMFFLSGIMLVASATVLIVWNAPAFTWLIGQMGKTSSRWLPAVRTAVAYPLERKGRTGMTIAMFSLVIFALVMMATMMATASELVYGSEHASGGWDVQVTQSPVNAIDDLEATLAAEGVDTRDIAAVSTLHVIGQNRSQVRMAGDAEWSAYTIQGADDAFLTKSSLPLQARAVGYDSDAAVWEAVRSGENLAVIDNNALGGQMMFGATGFQLEGIENSDNVFEPVQLEIGEPITGRVTTVSIVGVMDTKVVTFPGITISQATFDNAFREDASVSYLMHNIRVADGADPAALARQIESSLISYGAQASAWQDILAEYSQTTMGLLRLIEGFMLLGLVVGIAALGVIAFRSVVERRQQIGMLRAIGFRQRMIAATFMIEASMITVLGTLSGTLLALLLARQVVRSDYFYGADQAPAFVVPVLDVVAFTVIALAASLLMAWIPARRAAKAPIAEALRYE